MFFIKIMNNLIAKKLFFVWLLFFVSVANAQNNFIIHGQVLSSKTNKAVQNATISIKESNTSTVSKKDGSFILQVNNGRDSLVVSCIGYETFYSFIDKNSKTVLTIILKEKVNDLQELIVGIAKKPGLSFMEKVIKFKAANNPLRFNNYSYQRYTRNELALENIDYKKIKGKGLKSLMLKTYASLDSSAIQDKELPVYFAEAIASVYHKNSPSIDRENIIAKKTLGLETDDLLRKFNKFYFNFNIYDDWIPIFDQTYASPLNSNIPGYYKYFLGDKLEDNGDTLQQVRFTPLHAYEKAFDGTFWINTKTLAVETLNMHLTKTTNLNFINNIIYSEDYKQVYDSSAAKSVYMPYKFSSEIKFNSGLELLGLPGGNKKTSINFTIKNTTITDKIKINISDAKESMAAQIKKEQTTDWEKSDLFWQTNRPDSLSNHERNIYRMVDSLKVNNRFQRDVKLIAFVGSGYWDFSKLFRLGPYTSFISKNSIEGWRTRVGLWTLPGFSKKLNIFGYGAYGAKDKRIKGLLGVKYVWNAARWTKTTISYGSDYDFIIEQSEEVDKDNIINSLLRKKIPFSRMFIKSGLINHEQYISPNFTARASIGYRELNPVFPFRYRPIDPRNRRPFENVFAQKLPVAEASVGIRYAHNERTTLLNYDNIKIGSFFPIFYANYTYGFELGKAKFIFNKISIGMQHRLQLPPKMMFYYKIDAGKILGTIPYILLNIPVGNEYYVASKYQFNTMAPYEFAADKYISLHTRLHLEGAIFDKVPLLRRLGWRERISFNSYLGSMTKANLLYNKGSNFHITNKAPFMETSVGIENILHLLAIDYYWRLNYLNNRYARKGGVYIGLALAF